MNLFKYTFLAFFILPLSIFAQFSETIRTGRPGQGIGAYTLGKDVLQIQSGLNLNEIEVNDTYYTINTWNTVIRLGILERFEISGLINLQNEVIEFNDNIDPVSIQENRLDRVAIGGRYNISKNEGIVPAIGIQSRITYIPSTDFNPHEETTVNNVLVLSNKLSDKLALMSNWLLIVPGNSSPLRTRYVANLSYAINDEFGAFIEIYGSLGQNHNMNYDGGFSYLVNNDLQLDFSAGYQGTQLVSDYFIDFGVSWRTDWRE